MSQDVSHSSADRTGSGSLAHISQENNFSEYRCLAYQDVQEGSAIRHPSFESQSNRSRSQQTGKPTSTGRSEGRSNELRAVRQLLRQAAVHSDMMIAFCKRGDFMGLAIEGKALTDTLDDLWGKRSVKSKEWASALNFLQSAITRYVFEKMTEEQCRSVHSVVSDYLGAEVGSKDELRAVTRTLKQSGLDPFRAISADEKG